MSLVSCSSKISDVIEVLSVQTVTDDDEWNVPRPVEEEHIDHDKQIFTDAMHYCMVLLRQSNRITSHRSEVLSLASTLMGHEIFERIIAVNVQMDVETENETLYLNTNNVYTETGMQGTHDARQLYLHENSINIKEEITDKIIENKSSMMSATKPSRIDEAMDKIAKNIPSEIDATFEKDPHEETADAHQLSDSSLEVTLINIEDKNFPPSPISLSGSENLDDNSYKKTSDGKQGRRRVPISLTDKKKTIELARLHPEWPLKMLRKNGTPHLSSFAQLWQWEKQIASGGTIRDKYQEINNSTYERFVEARKNKVKVNKDVLREWAIKAARELYGPKLKFDASRHWIKTFRRLYGLKGNTNRGYITLDEQKSGKSLQSPTRKRTI